MKTLTKMLVVLLALMTLLLPLVSCIGATPENTDEKTITVKVIHKDKKTNTFTITTNKSTLLASMQQEKLIEGDSQAAGFYVTTVDGEKADWNVDQSWWCLTKGGEMLLTGADSTPIADGETYEFTYTIG